MIKEALVLAGGLGTRLKNVVQDRPKPMALINGRPFLEYLLDFLMHSGVKKVILAVGYKKEYIKDHFGTTYKNLSIIYSEEDEPLGTGGAIKKALTLIEQKDFFILNGDTYFKINLKSFFGLHKEKKSILSTALKFTKNSQRYGTVMIDDENKIIGFEEKGKSSEGLINGGIYIASKKILGILNELPEKFSFEKDFLEKFYHNFVFYGFPFDEYFIDIGVPEDYERAQKEFESFTDR